MKAISVERCISEGKLDFDNLFQFVEKNAGGLTGYEMEKSILQMIQKIGLAAMKCYFAAKGTGDVGEELELDSGLNLRKESGLRGRDYYSVFGKIKVPRSCYRLEGVCGLMPLDAQVDFPDRCYSYLLQEFMDLTSIRDSFGECGNIFFKLLGLEISPSRFEVISQESCTSYDDFYEKKEPCPPESEGEIHAVGFDGKGVPVIKSELAELESALGEGEKRPKKKEAMVGVSYSVDRKVRSAKEVADNLVYPEKKERERKQDAEQGKEVRARNIRRFASLKRSREEVVTQIIEDALSRDPEHKKPLVVLMDGALSLWRLVERVLKGVEYVGILDIIHVSEYAWCAGNALYGEKNDDRKEWVHSQLREILEGNVEHVLEGLREKLREEVLSGSQIKTLESTIRYFENHKQWMRYDEYLAAGYPIGTGVVESTCGHTVKDRMEGSGRRWSIEGAEATLLLRSVYTSGDWESYWEAHMRRERILMDHRMFEGIGYPDDYEGDGSWFLGGLTGTYDA